MSGQKRKRAVSDATTLLTNFYSSENSTVIAQDSFEGVYVKCFQYVQIRVSVSSDVDGVLSIISSFDGENDNETTTYTIVGGTTFSTASALIQPWIKVSFTADTPGTISSLTIYTLLARTPTSSITSEAGDVSLVSSSLGPDMKIKALCEGNNITLADDGECITINSNSAGTVTLSSFGTGVSLVEDGAGPDISVNSLVSGSDISITDDPVNGVVIANTAPDQTVALNSADTSVTITGTYPTFDLQVTGGTATDVTWTSVGGGSSIVNQSLGPNLVAKSIIGGSGINVTDGGNVLTVVNTAPDQTVALSNGTGINTTGSYPNFTISNTAPDQTVTLTAGPNIIITGTYPNFTVEAASGSSSNPSISIVKTNPDGSWIGDNTFGLTTTYAEYTGGLTFESSLRPNLSNPSGLRIQNTAAATRTFYATGTFVYKNRDDLGLALAINTTVIEESKMETIGNTFLQTSWPITLNQNDYVSLYVRRSSTQTVDIHFLSLQIIET